MGGWVRCGGIGRADSRRAGADVCGPASGACGHDGLGFFRRLRGRGEPGCAGGGFCPCFPAAGEPGGLAVPGGGAGAGAGWLLGCLRAACAGRGPGVLPGGPGVRLAVQLDLGDPARHARVCVPAFPGRAAALTAVAPGRVVRGRRVRADWGGPARERDRFWSDPYSPASQAGNPLVLAPLLMVATFIASIFINSVAVNVLQNVAFLCLWVAIGIAVLKYRLYEIEIVISKAVLYGS